MIRIGRFLSFAVAATLVTNLFHHASTNSRVAALSASSMPPPTTGTNGFGDDNAPVILVIGACALDRLLTVSGYPEADSKIRTTSYDEAGGGNAANTASAIGKLRDAGLFSSPRASTPQGSNPGVRVELLTKVGDDGVGQQIIDDLGASNVGTSSLLFRKGGAGSTTSFTTVIVDRTQHTRTCIHTPGTCGELSLDDVASLSRDDIDRVFRNAIHLHSDSRHTDVSLWMAKEAKRRGITVSCDCEKDRRTTALDELIDTCDILFTNSNHIGEYLERRTRDHEASAGCRPLPKPTITAASNPQPDEADTRLIETCVNSLAPSAYFARWQEKPSIGKEVVVTHGSMGALHYKQIESSEDSGWSSAASSGESKNAIEIETDDTAIVRIRHSFDDGTKASDHLYEVQKVGILKEAEVVDTTGAGDAFIGGYILVSNTPPGDEETTIGIGSRVRFALEVGSFVGGRKVGGPGARSALPTGKQFDELLGSSAADARASLQNLLGSFDSASAQE